MKGAYETAAGKVTATLVHAAPELLGGQSPGPASDLYALASTMYELLAGAPPFWLRDEDIDRAAAAAHRARRRRPTFARVVFLRRSPTCSSSG